MDENLTPPAAVADRSDLIRAAAVFGGCVAVGVVLASVVIVAGVWWAMHSVLSREVTALRADVAMSAAGIETSVGAASGEVAGQIDQAAAGLTASVTGVSDRVGVASGAITRSLGEASTGVTASLDTNAGSLGETLNKSFEVPLLVRAFEPLPITGTMSIQGAEGDDARPVQVEAELDGLP